MAPKSTFHLCNVIKILLQNGYFMVVFESTLNFIKSSFNDRGGLIPVGLQIYTYVT